MTWRNPQPESTPISGYQLFQRLNTNQSGEIDPTGENIVEKYYNPSTISILYRDFIPPVFKYLFTEGSSGGDFHRIINAVDPEKDVTETLSAHSGTGSNSDIRMAWNNGDDWFVDRVSRYFHSEDGGDSWTQEAIFGTKLSHSIPAILNNTLYFVDRGFNKVYKWVDGEFVETAGQPNTSNISLANFESTNNITLRSIFVDDGKLYAVGLGDAFGELKNSPVLYMSDNEGATWTRTRVFVIEDVVGNFYQFENWEGGRLFNFKRLGNRFFITGDSNNEESNYLLPTFSGSLDNVDTTTSYMILDDNIFNQETNYNNTFFQYKITVHGFTTSYKPVLKVIEATGETDYSSTLLALYDGPDLEWEALYVAFKDEDTIIVSFAVWDSNAGTDIYETHELNLTTSALTKLSDDSELKKYYQIH